MILLAWRFLQFQKDRALAQWFAARVSDGRGGTRKTMIVVLARKPSRRMGPPPLSLAADAHGCIMFESLKIDRIQACGAFPTPIGGLPSDYRRWPRRK